MKCKFCGYESDGVTNSRDELRCPGCYELMPKPEKPKPKPRPEKKPQPQKPATRRSEK